MKRTSRPATATLALLLVATAAASSQERSDAAALEYAETDPMNVAVAFRIGVSMATPRGDFPSLIIEPSKRGTGTIGQAFGEPGIGPRFEVAVLVPLIPSVGLSLGVGSQTSVVGYGADSSRRPTRFEVQSLQWMIGVQWSVLSEPMSYLRGGLRSVYIDGGFDVGLATLANRVESSSYADTLEAPPEPIVGSFTSTEPFRNVVALRGAIGLRFAASPQLELVAETAYSFALNRFFSSESVEGNDFAIDVLGATIGIGYRF